MAQSSEYKTYLNGKLEATVSAGGRDFSSYGDIDRVEIGSTYGTVGARLGHFAVYNKPLSEAEIKQIATSILEILIYLHGLNPPVIHRDIKPSNILLGDRSGNSVGQIYLIDFGSVQTDAAKEGGTMTVVRTYGYIPPEQFGSCTVPASDLHSLGATLIY